MNTKENRPDAATSERIRAEKAACAGASFPYHDFTTIPRRRQVASFLRVGRSRGIRRNDLANMMGLDERELRRQIQRERQQGTLIISDCHNGYFLPETTEEIRIFVAQMRHRAKEINAVTQAAEVELARMEGQETLEGW